MLWRNSTDNQECKERKGTKNLKTNPGEDEDDHPGTSSPGFERLKADGRSAFPCKDMNRGCRDCRSV